MDEFDGDDVLIVVDAVQFGAPSGTIHVRRWNELPLSEGGAVSAHGIGVREAIEVASLLYPERTPALAFLVGIEGQNFAGLGDAVSLPVAAAVDTAAGVVKQLLETHLT